MKRICGILIAMLVTAVTVAGVRLPSGAMQFGVLDNVSTQYAGNQLVAIVNPAQGGNFEGRTGVGVMPAQEITYDFAGRILSDESRGIDRIYYDNDGHPVRIDFTAGHRHLLTYDGLGRLMSVAYFQQVSSAAGTACKGLTGGQEF